MTAYQQFLHREKDSLYVMVAIAAASDLHSDHCRKQLAAAEVCAELCESGAFTHQPIVFNLIESAFVMALKRTNPTRIGFLRKALERIKACSELACVEE